MEIGEQINDSNLTILKVWVCFSVCSGHLSNVGLVHMVIEVATTIKSQSSQTIFKCNFIESQFGKRIKIKGYY